MRVCDRPLSIPHNPCGTQSLAMSNLHEEIVRESMKNPHEKILRDGLKVGWPICLGYFPIGLAFGVLAQKAGLHPLEIGIMSLLVFAARRRGPGVPGSRRQASR